MKTKNRRTIIGIDGTNVAFRYLAIQNPSYPPIVSMLNDISKICTNLKPDELFIAWEGLKSRDARRKIFPDYKANRDVDNKYSFSIKEIKKQVEVFDQYIAKALPMRQLRIDYLEADDSLALLSRHYYSASENNVVILVSTDKDYYQLVNERVFVFDPKKRILHTPKGLFEEFGIKNPKNHAWIKAICGDPADNIPGVKGIGFKTFGKLLGDLMISDDVWTVDQIQERMNTWKKPVNMNEIEIFFQIIQLHKTLTLEGLSQFNSILTEDFDYEFNDIEFGVIMEQIHKDFIRYNNSMIKRIAIAMNEFVIRKQIERNSRENYDIIT